MWVWMKELESEANNRDILSYGLTANSGLQIRMDAVVVHSLSFKSAPNEGVRPFRTVGTACTGA